ncbi:sulfur oxidation c-type cytochrome SoxX, partial [Thermus thermamylovorans]
MKKVPFALLLALPALYLALAGLSALAQRYLNERELEAVRTAGRAYWEAFANQRPDQALCSLHRNRLPPEALGEFLAEQRALI